MKRRIGAAAVLVVLLVACATTGLGKAIQAADLQKRLVEESAVEFIKLHLKGDPRITQAVYDEAKMAYGKWSVAQTAYAASLATWQAAKTQANEQRLNATLANADATGSAYLNQVGKFVDMNAVKAKVGG